MKKDKLKIVEHSICHKHAYDVQRKYWKNQAHSHAEHAPKLIDYK